MTVEWEVYKARKRQRDLDEVWLLRRQTTSMLIQPFNATEFKGEKIMETKYGFTERYKELGITINQIAGHNPCPSGLHNLAYNMLMRNFRCKEHLSVEHLVSLVQPSEISWLISQSILQIITPEVTYSKGDYFCKKDGRKSGIFYIIANIDTDKVILINCETGTRFHTPKNLRVVDVEKITKDEFKTICNGKSSRFEKIERPF